MQNLVLQIVLSETMLNLSIILEKYIDIKDND